MSRKIIVFFSCLLVVGGIVLFWLSNNAHQEKGRTLRLNGQQFSIEVVADQASMQKGLGGRKELCGDCGMLFVFAQTGRHAFWMRDMYFPLDIIWIANQKVVHVAEEVAFNSPAVMRPPVDADMVLEINAGLCRQYGIKLGDKVEYR